ncbi:3-oxoacyl-[acyl-carrier protein] reductase [Halanaerobium saccharolyticum subsp. saccharolyticum DSM 6643]|uniref:3-oxoacyl-[acyl-carrier protein] reductase n=1 Tax=Halanaerobium saccharolyticum subsp. saccharolyticum DSM 6643 TaxID=1293054 RepID=M5DZR3_9FIRM|nr:SDR family NAD(P)-dependent oxidoreductase [Halanaerobium saccharolyticum]CCU78758.1 3-oxoacyl-[acyl-carrier protein] reductase [Halanaerobium saccharolyticum subsp. saccharolyticum DSM 6643]
MYTIDLKDKVAVVTGGNRGIGKSIVEILLKAGAKVVVYDMQVDSVEELKKEYGEENIAGYAGSVTDSKAVEKMTTEVVEHFGSYDLLINNAGISTMDYVVDIKEEDWDKVMDVNAKGVFLVSQQAARQMLKQENRGKIINISSQAGKNGYRGMGNYVSSKHAVLGLTKTMAVELAPEQINVNAVCPGIVETEMKHRERVIGAEVRGMKPEEIEAEDNSQVPLGRTAQPEEIAKVVLFLASEMGDYLTGQAVNVTGGMTMH